MRAAIIFALVAICPLLAAEPAMDEELLGPFPDWYDLKRDFHAVGDGIADDTAALQKALDSVGTPELRRTAIWVPAGTYRITRTLVRTDVSGVFLIGEHPDTTIIRWDGPAYGGEARVPAFGSAEWKAWDGRHPAEMFWFNGRNSRFERLTFDGGGKAASGIAFKWNSTDGNPPQGPSHRTSLADVVFKDMAIGFDGGGKQLWLDSEVLMQRCRFERCSQFGVGLHHFNSVDYWLWSCTFTDCAVGVSNEPKPHGGVIHVYDSLFSGSKEADFTVLHGGFFALRHNTSIGSRRFVHAKNNGPNGASIQLQGNRVVDPVESDAVLVETLGNVNLMDNIFVSRTESSGPVVRGGVAEATAPAWERKSGAFVDGWAPMCLSMVGNTFSVGAPVQIHGQSFELDTRTVNRSELLAAAPVPTMPGVLPRHRRQVFEVTAGADAAMIQAAIDAAVQVAGSDHQAWPVVHLAHGRYQLKRTLTIPAGARIQVAGDGCYTWGDGPRGTVLAWTDEEAPGPVMLIHGPAQARLRDFGIVTPEPWRRSDEKLRTPGIAGLSGPVAPNLVAAIVAEGIDQPGGRVHLQECNPDGLFGIGTLVEGLDQTFVQVMACEGTGLDGDWNRKWDGTEKRDPWGPYPAMRVIGGPLAQAGTSVPGVLVQGGDTGRWDVQRGGKLIVRDCWYESNSKPFHMFLRGDGRLTMDGGYDAQYTHPSLKGAGVSYLFDGWHGQFVSLNIGGHYSRDNPPTAFAGDCTGARILFIGNAGDAGTPPPVAPAGVTILDINRRTGSSVEANPQAIAAEFVREQLKDARETRFQALTPLPSGTTDLRMSRIWTWNGRIGLHLKAR